MKHALRKYLSPCGSALFMVVSTMAALIVLVTAMYMSVVSAGRVQYATFFEEQAYVTSTSVSDIICSYLADGKNASKPLVAKVLNLKPGDKIETKDGNGFASLGSGSEIDTALGGYSVGITRLNNETIGGQTWYVYDIAVTAVNSDIVETTHTFMRVRDKEPNDPPDIDRFFTATGYIPNDVFISSGIFNETMYFDAEYVEVTKIPGSAASSGLDLNSGLVCAGTIKFDHSSAQPVEAVDGPITWAIGGNMILNSQPLTYSLGGSNSNERGTLIVGGDLIVNSQMNFGSATAPTDVYVLGNVYAHAPLNVYGNLFVNGKLVVDHVHTSTITMLKGGRIYHSGNYDVVPNPNDSSRLAITYDTMSVITPSEFDGHRWNIDVGSPEYMMSPEDAKQELTDQIGNSLYPKWVVDVDAAQSNVKDIWFNSNWGETSIVGKEVVYYKGDELEYKVVSSYYDMAQTTVPPKFVEVIDSDCTIGDIVDFGSWGWTLPTIIFDTGAAGNVLTINLKANTALDPDHPEELNGFSWSAAGMSAGGTLMPHEADKIISRATNIITIGDGTLIINVPDGVTYQTAPREFFGHYAWYKLAGGSIDKSINYNGAAIPRFNQVGNIARSVVESKIHKSDNCDVKDGDGNIIGCGCNYIKCTNSNGEEGWTCTTHGGFVSSSEKPTQCYCDARIEKHLFTGSQYEYEGVPQQPNVNIFIVSCSESADIQIGCMKYVTNGFESVDGSAFYGYVYAPYLTYMDKGGGSGQGVKCCGGLIVSDYIMSGYYEYVFAKPDVSIKEIVGENFEALEPKGNRSWRVYGT